MKNHIELGITCMAILTIFACSPSGKVKEHTINGSNDSAKQLAVTDSTNQVIKKQEIKLPPPYDTKSAIHFSKAVGWPEDLSPKAPPGFLVTKFAGNLQNPRWIYELPNGDVLVAETKKEEKGIKKVIAKVTGIAKTHNDKTVNLNRISLFRDTNKDGTPDLQTVFIENLNLPFGMVLINNYFYVANTDALWRFPYKTGQTSIMEKGERLVDLPTEGRHWTRSLIANASGTKIYIGVGSASDVAEKGMDKELNRAAILEVNPDGSGLKIYASGLRNPVGMDWFPGTTTLWTAVNERDGLGDELVPDYLTSVQEGGFYGWPYSYFGQHEDPRIKEKDRRPDLVKRAIVPDIPLGAHTASLGLTFYTKKAFPPSYYNGAFIGQHGSWNRSVFSGYQVVFVPFKGKNPGKAESFLTGFIKDEEKKEVYGRPVGVITRSDGSLLVADDVGNAIWRITYSK
jgi:glucose/arabinose dehydrogenase